MKTLEGVPPGDRLPIESSNADSHQTLARGSPVPENRKDNKVQRAPPKANAQVVRQDLEEVENAAILFCLLKLFVHQLDLLRENDILRAQAPHLIGLVGVRFSSSRSRGIAKFSQSLPSLPQGAYLTSVRFSRDAPAPSSRHRFWPDRSNSLPIAPATAANAFDPCGGSTSTTHPPLDPLRGSRTRSPGAMPTPWCSSSGQPSSCRCGDTRSPPPTRRPARSGFESPGSERQ